MAKKTCFLQGEAVIASKGTELFNAPRERSRNLIDLKGSDASSFPKRFIDFSWLSSAAKVYNLSEDIGDYICVPVPLVTSDIPNRNMQGFALEDLVEFDPKLGRMRFQTFVGKPTFINHQNTVLRDAKGVNLDVTLAPLKNYRVVKIVVLSAFDRTKDPVLCNEILAGKRNAYSMGALAEYFICSVCGGELGPAVKRSCNCLNVDYRNLRTLGGVVGGTLQYLLAKNFTFIENSSVDSPADISAIGKKFV